jgi:iron(III)-salmochelin esterase
VRGRGPAAVRRVGRAALVAGAVLAVALVGLGQAPAGGQDERFVHERWLRVEGPSGGAQRAYVVFPFRGDRKEHPEGERYPLVIALHGRGESQKGPVRGPRGWVIDYELPAAFGALARGQVTRGDYRGLVTDAHLAVVNAELTARAFGGAMVVAPFVPDLGAGDASITVEDYAAWLAGPLLAQVREEYPGAARGRRSVGIDGVSLGGWLALEAGLAHPDVFGSVGGIQPAIRGREQALAQRAAEARQGGAAQHLRLLTSKGDPYRGPTQSLSKMLRDRRVPHDLVVLPGPHDYEFNQGPGAMELLRFHGSVLSREPMADSPSL